MGIDSVRFRGRHVSPRSVVFLVTGSLSLIALPVLCIISAAIEDAVFALGVTGFCAGILSLIGLINSVRTFRERDIYLGISVAGMIVNGVTLVIYVIIYFLGLS